MERVDFETFCADPQLIGEPISKPWAVFYAAMDGLPLDDEGIEIYRACTGRDRYDPRVYTECAAICGRRSEKTSTALKYLLWKAIFGDWAALSRPSWFERVARQTKLLRIPLIAQDQRISRDIHRMLESYVLNSPVLSAEVEEVFVREIVFKNGIGTIVLPASKASVRGMSAPGGLLDEYAWVSVEGASDVELVRQIRPAMITFGQSRRLLKLTTPWLRSGLPYAEFSTRAGRDDVLVWNASTSYMNPRISREELEKERAADPIYFAREYEAVFTDDLENFLPQTDVTAAIATWKELPPVEGPYYLATLDASGLSGGDRFTFAVGHSDASGHKVDLLRGWRREPVAQVLDEIAALCKAYRVRNVIGDQYSATFVAELLRIRGVGFAQLPFSARSKPEVYFVLKNALASGKFQLPNHPDAIRELRALESQRTSGGGYRISAPRSENDDYATVLALLAHKIANSKSREPQFAVMQVPVGRAPAAGGPNSLDPANDWGFPRRAIQPFGLIGPRPPTNFNR